ncbi:MULTISPECIES: ATP12 family protein [unclassified Sphingomonas]|uniref:ATP12 family chaperone protein n=1 Tax=unclassified Sphingomonas TaxID=196159 RepID=UPI00226A056B|nr:MULTISPECIES: ATP12 family protein [unclassified Sphingomonas]
MKRFWTDVGIDEARVVTLNGRPVRTPGRVPLALPTAALAEAVAAEWRAVPETIDPRRMPLTGLANAAIDRIGPDPASFAAGLARYGESDLLCYRADGPDDLVARQAATWDPPLAWARARYDVHLELATGIIHRAQPAATIRRLGDAVAALDAFTLAGLSPLVTISGSLILGLALVERAMEPADIWAAANLDEDWQAERWGHDPLAADAREARRRDFDGAVRFLEAL